MKENNKIYFSTGEFAKIVGVTKHTLFHYDKLGIFSPQIKGENDYRYYSAFQVEPFFVISALKELGMPLKEIKAYLQIRNPNELISLLNIQNEKIDKEINRLVAIKELLFISDALPSSNYESIALSFATHMKCCADNNITSPFSVGQMLSLKNVQEGTYNLYNFFYTKITSSLSANNIYHKEEGSYLTA